MTYTIDAFWVPRLADAEAGPAPLIPGWQSVRQGLPTFHEAPIALTDEFGDVPTPPSTAPLILVSAPGAVGKSTLARQIAYRTGSVYVDLAATGPVGENTLSGGLLQSGLLDGWSKGTVALLIDGLDEARLRVTGEALESFLRDVARLSSGRPLPTVLFGRTGAIEYAWLVLAEELAPPVLEISYYDEQASIAFARARVQHTSATPAHLPGPISSRRASTLAASSANRERWRQLCWIRASATCSCRPRRERTQPQRPALCHTAGPPIGHASERRERHPGPRTDQARISTSGGSRTPRALVSTKRTARSDRGGNLRHSSAGASCQNEQQRCQDL